MMSPKGGWLVGSLVEADRKLCGFGIAVIAEIAPAWVLPGQAQDEVDNGLVESVGCCALTARINPGPGDQVPVPAQQGRRPENLTIPAGEGPVLGSRRRALVAGHGPSPTGAGLSGVCEEPLRGEQACGP